ncbi:baseplate J/gp47 family protein [Sorangium sp. So ce1151]|uniref:baseplate J/gp47 family protein n=1 Tax=Sorangium sp. So ce1151 TaxID=3133332 RepID=UPI003F63761F
MLPIDQLIQPLSKDQVKGSIYRLLTATGLPVSSWHEGAVARTIIAIIAAIFAGFTDVIAIAIRMNFLDLAEGIWLTLLALYVYGVERIDATYATGQLTLVNAGGGVYEFEAGEFFARNPVTDAHYTNVSHFELLAGQTLTIDIRAVDPGEGSSSAATLINDLVTDMLFVTCSNATALVGRNAESDPALRQRCRDALGSRSPNGPEAAYLYWAKSAKKSDGSTVAVNRVWVSKSSSTGQVQVYVASPSGAVAGTLGDLSTDLGAVNYAIQRIVVPLCVTCTVSSAVQKAIAVTGTAWVYAAANLSDAQWSTAFEQRIRGYLSEAPIGGHVLTSTPGYIYRNALIGQVESVSSQVIKFDPSLPAGDVVLAQGEVPVAGTTTIAVQQVG